MMATERDIWQLLEEDAPQGCEAVQDLYSWSLNYEAGTGPFSLFLDLIGYSEEHFGTQLYTGNFASGLGYVELAKLADALKEYADQPHDVHAYTFLLVDTEGRS